MMNFVQKEKSKLEEVWSKLELAMLPVQKFSIFNPALGLFREANSCYQNGAYLATAVMCGVALESAVYLALTRNRKGGFLLFDKGYVDSQWGDIVRSAKEKKIIDGGIENEINFIRNRRNYASHFAERRDKGFLEISAKASVNESQVLWIIESAAFRVIEKTQVLLKIIISRSIAKKGLDFRFLMSSEKDSMRVLLLQIPDFRFRFADSYRVNVVY